MDMFDLTPIVGVLLAIAGYWLRRTTLAIAGAAVFLVMGLYSYSQYVTMWDVHYSLFWLYLGISIALMVDSVYVLIQEQAKQNREERQATIDEKRDEAIEANKDKYGDKELNPMDKLRIEQGLKPLDRAKFANRRNLRYNVEHKERGL